MEAVLHLVICFILFNRFYCYIAWQSKKSVTTKWNENLRNYSVSKPFTTKIENINDIGIRSTHSYTQTIFSISATHLTIVARDEDVASTLETASIDPSSYTKLNTTLYSTFTTSIITRNAENSINTVKKFSENSTITNEDTSLFRAVKSTSVIAVNHHEKNDSTTPTDDADPHGDLSKKASIIVGIGFLPGVAFLFVFCRYVPEWCAKMADT